ncbi:hypothetical protein Droror1_Dr00018315 [Drosera rotundifolia]
MSSAIYHVLGLKGLEPGAFCTPRYKVGRLEQLKTSEEAKARGVTLINGINLIYSLLCGSGTIIPVEAIRLMYALQYQATENRSKKLLSIFYNVSIHSMKK